MTIDTRRSRATMASEEALRRQRERKKSVVQRRLN